MIKNHQKESSKKEKDIMKGNYYLKKIPTPILSPT